MKLKCLAFAVLTSQIWSVILSIMTPPPPHPKVLSERIPSPGAAAGYSFLKVMASFLSKCNVPEQRQIYLKFLICSGIPFHPQP